MSIICLSVAIYSIIDTFCGNIFNIEIFAQNILTFASIISLIIHFFLTYHKVIPKYIFIAFLLPVIGVFAFLMVPMIRAIMSTMTPIDKQGSMFASMAVVQIISSIAGVPLGNEIYSATLYFMNGFVFLVLAFFCLIDFVLLVINLRLKPKEYISIVQVEGE